MTNEVDVVLDETSLDVVDDLGEPEAFLATALLGNLVGYAVVERLTELRLACRDTLDGASFVLFDSHKLFAD